MARLIDTSIDGVKACSVRLSMTGKVIIDLPYGWNAHKYTEDQIALVTVIDEDKYRSAGGAAAGAIIGGVLTGGIGLLAGAALGGRRQNKAAFLITFEDGHHVALEEPSRGTVDALLRLAQARKITDMIAERRAQTDGPDQSITASIPAGLPATPAQPARLPTPWLTIAFWLLVIFAFFLTLYTYWDTEMPLFMAFVSTLPLLLIGGAVVLLRAFWRWVRPRS
jgi:hypothetical protein